MQITGKPHSRQRKQQVGMNLECLRIRQKAGVAVASEQRSQRCEINSKKSSVGVRSRITL